jgi:hypothetical protein
MSEPQIVFPLSVIQTEFLQSRNQRAIDLVQDAVRTVAKDCNVPVGIDVAPNEELTALIVQQRPGQAPPQPPLPTAEEVLEAHPEIAEAVEEATGNAVKESMVEADEPTGEPG